MELLGIFFNSKSVSFLNFACFTRTWITQASKQLVIIEYALQFPEFTIVVQCYDNKNAVGSFIFDVFIQNRLRSFFTLLC
jgi:hypothetical protein